MMTLCSRSYKAHTTPVNSIQWSTFLPDVFISCASEFVIKIWSKTYRYHVSHSAVTCHVSHNYASMQGAAAHV